MYELIRTLIDDVLMGPQLAPFTVSFLVIIIAVFVAWALSGGDSSEESD